MDRPETEKKTRWERRDGEENEEIWLTINGVPLIRTVHSTRHQMNSDDSFRLLSTQPEFAFTTVDQLFDKLRVMVCLF